MSVDLVPDHKMRHALGFLATVGSRIGVSDSELIAYVNDATAQHGLGRRLAIFQLAALGPTTEDLPNRLRTMEWALGTPLAVTELGRAVWEEVRKAATDETERLSTEGLFFSSHRRSRVLRSRLLNASAVLSWAWGSRNFDSVGPVLAIRFEEATTLPDAKEY